MSLYHDPFPSAFEARIHVKGLEKEVVLIHVADSHLVELSAEDEARIEAVMPLESFKSSAARRGALGRFRQIFDKARELEARAIMLTGDIASFPSAANLKIMHEHLDGCGIPYLYVYGNHDWHFSHLEEWNDEVRAQALPLFRKLFKSNSDFQVMDVAGILCIAIDNSNYQVTDDQLRLLREHAATGAPYLLFMHIPLRLPQLQRDVLLRWEAPIMIDGTGWTEEQYAEWGTRPSDPATKAFREWVTAGDAGNLLGIFCGHVHFSHAEQFREGRAQYVCHPGYDAGFRVIRLLPGPQ